jgi:hypothetical protein
MNTHATRAVPEMGKALHDAATINALVSRLLSD